MGKNKRELLERVVSIGFNEKIQDLQNLLKDLELYYTNLWYNNYKQRITKGEKLQW